MLRFTIISVVLMISLLSCKKIEKYTNFYITVTDNFYFNPNEAEDDIVDVWLFKTSDNVHEKFTEYDTDIGQTEKIAFASINISLTENGQIYNNDIESIEVYLEAMDQDQILVGWNHEVNKTKDSIIELDFSDTDIKNYIINNYKVLYIKIKVLNSIDVDIKSDLKYKLYISSELNET